MTALVDLFHEPIVSKLGWMLVHSIWLGVVVSAGVACLLTLIPKRAASVRYVLACTGILAMATLPVVALYLFEPSGGKAEASVPPATTEPVIAAVDTPTPPAIRAPGVEAPGMTGVVNPSTSETHQVAAPTPPVEPPAPVLPWRERALSTCERLMPWLVAGWLTGVALMSLRLLAGWVEVQRMKRRFVEPVTDALRHMLDDLVNRVGVSRPVSLLRSGLARVPMAMGWWRPVILLPATALTGLTEDQIRAIIAHELAHIRRYDYLINLLQSVIETLLFYHPAVWWLSYRVRAEREHCCDDIAVRVCGSRVDYVRALTELEVLRNGKVWLIPAATSGSLLSRVRRLLNMPAARSARSGRSLAGLLTVAVVAAIGLTVLLSPFTTLAENEENEALLNRRIVEFADYKVEVSFTPDNAKPMLGEPVFITLEVRNLGDRSIFLEHGGDSRGFRSWRYKFTIVDADGRPVRDPNSDFNAGGPTWLAEITPGLSYTEKVFLPLWCAFEHTGKHTVTCKRTLDLSSDKNGRSNQQHHPVELSFKLELQPYDPDAMNEVITQWGRQVREAEGTELVNACRALAYIDDARVVPWLTEAMEKGDFTNKIPTMDGLAKHPTAASVKALTAPLRDMKDHAVREHAGRALAKMAMQDAAASILITELETAQGEERATCMTGLGHTGSSLAWDPLTSGIREGEASVRHAAAEALGVLGDPRAIAVLKGLLTDGDHGLRVAAVKGLLALDQPLRADWLTPVIKAATDINDRNFHESIRLLQLYGKEQAAPGLVSCLHFDDPSPRNSFNMFLLQYIEASPNGPKYYYKFHHDPNTDGTPEQIENNRQILAELKQWLDDTELRGTALSPPSTTQPAVLSGVVMTPANRPAVGAELILVPPDNMVWLQDGVLKYFDQRMDTEQEMLRRIKADDQGRFAFHPDVKGYVVIALHDEGVAHVPVYQLNESHRIQLQAWGRIEGTILKGGTPAIEKLTWQQSYFSTGPGNDVWVDGASNIVHNWDVKRVGDDRFVVERVVPGRVGGSGGLATLYGGIHLIMMDVEPGKTTRITPETRRSLTGQLVPRPGSDFEIDSSRAQLTLSRPWTYPPFGHDEEDWKFYGERVAKMQALKKQVTGEPYADLPQPEAPELSPDGRITCKDLVPGSYTLTVWTYERPVSEGLEHNPPTGRAHHTITVPAAAPGKEDAPFDAGRLVVHPMEKPDSRDANAGAGKQSEWGEAVEGVKCRLKPDRVQWRVGEIPTFKADLRNEGDGEYIVIQAQDTCELELDGIWHFWMGPVNVLESLLRANSEYKGIPVTLGEHWYPKDAAEAPKLDIGKHTVRIAFFLGRYHDLSEPRQFRVISNPVEIEILPAIADSEAHLKPAVRDLARRAIEIEADNSPPFDGPEQRTTGLELTPILKATGQADEVRSFPADRGRWEAEIERLGKQDKLWALCALLDRAEADVKLGAARELSKRAGPEQVPVLLAAAKRNNYGVSGSENATIHALYRKYLKQGLERATSLALTPAGLTLVIYPPPGDPVTIRSEDNPAHFEAEVDFQKVEAWLRERFRIEVSASVSESATRLPWVVRGRVTDAPGNPIAGAEVRAHCRMGTLFQTGSTTSAADGTYTLRFSTGFSSPPFDVQSTPLQAAIIFCFKPGLYERHLCRQGELTMAGKRPEKDNGWRVDPDAVLLPDQPRELNFVMVPAATLKGYVVDQDGRPFRTAKVNLSGDEMYPATSVLAVAQADGDGAFDIPNVPCKKYHLDVELDVKGPDGQHWSGGPIGDIDFAKPGTYSIRITIKPDDVGGVQRIRHEISYDPPTRN